MQEWGFLEFCPQSIGILFAYTCSFNKIIEQIKFTLSPQLPFFLGEIAANLIEQLLHNQGLLSSRECALSKALAWCQFHI